MTYQPQTIAGFNLLDQQQPLDEQSIYWIGQAQEWATGGKGIALYTDERTYNYGLLIFLSPEQAKRALTYLKALLAPSTEGG